MTRMLFATLLFGACTAANTARADDPALNDPNWPTYQGSSSHSGFIDRDLHPGRARTLWSRQVQDGRAISGMAAAEGFLYTTPATYFGAVAPLIAVDAKTGTQQWSVDFAPQFSVNAPAYWNGRVYLQTDNESTASYIRAYDAHTGAFVWRSEVGAQWEHFLAPTPIDGTIYFNGGTYGGLYAFDASTGQGKYFTQLPQYDAWTPVPYGADKLLNLTNRLDVVDRASGAALYSVDVPSFYWSGYSVGQVPVVLGDMAYYTNGGYLNGADLVAKSTPIHLALNASGQVSTDGKELFVLTSGALSVRRPSDGAQLWAAEASPAFGFRQQFVVFRNYVIGSSSEETVVVNRLTHAVDLRIPVAGKLIYANDTLFIAEDDGTVTAVELPSSDVFTDDFE